MSQQHLSRLYKPGWVFLLCSLLFITGCSSISHRDDTTLDYTKTTSEHITGLLFDLETLNKKEPDCRYENFLDEYKQIRVGLNTLQLREQAKLHNQKTIKQVENLRKSVDDLVSMHSKGCLSNGEIIVLQGLFNSLAGSIMKLEQAKPKPLFTSGGL